jgi:hypothetical protein
MDISRQLRHPLATMSANADKCYDQINYIIMFLLLLAIIGSMGPVVAMLHPIQMMKFFQLTARGDLTTFKRYTFTYKITQFLLILVEVILARAD